MWNREQRQKKAFRGQQRCRLISVALFALIFVACMLYIFGIQENPSSQIVPHKLKSKSMAFNASVEFMNGTDLIWQIPDSPKAVLFIAHGCNCRAANYWDKSPGCPNCLGFPEDRAIVLGALGQKFAVLTISSIGKCWSLGKEMQNVKWIIQWWIDKNKLEKLPVMGLGASSGGFFISALAAEMKFSSIVLMIAEGVFSSMGVPAGYPPTLFVHMPKDQRRMKLIEMNMNFLREKGIRVHEVRCLEFPLTPELLSDRVPGLDQALSINLFMLFREKGFINEKGYMRNDGRATRWKQALRERGVILEKHELLDHIQEELNLAYGYHEMTSLQLDDILNWFTVNTS